MADTPSTKRKFPSEWFQDKLEAIQDVEMPDSAKKDLASEFSKFPAHQLGDSDLNDLVGLIPAEISHAQKIVAMHLKHHIRKELQAGPWSVNDILFSFFVLLINFPHRLF